MRLWNGFEPSGHQQGGDASPSPDLAILPESGVEARSGLPWVMQRQGQDHCDD